MEIKLIKSINMDVTVNNHIDLTDVCSVKIKDCQAYQTFKIMFFNVCIDIWIEEHREEES
jgi:hypothetical protein